MVANISKGNEIDKNKEILSVPPRTYKNYSYNRLSQIRKVL